MILKNEEKRTAWIAAGGGAVVLLIYFAGLPLWNRWTALGAALAPKALLMARLEGRANAQNALLARRDSLASELGAVEGRPAPAGAGPRRAAFGPAAGRGETGPVQTGDSRRHQAGRRSDCLEFARTFRRGDCLRLDWTCRPGDWFRRHRTGRCPGRAAARRIGRGLRRAASRRRGSPIQQRDAVHVHAQLPRRQIADACRRHGDAGDGNARAAATALQAGERRPAVAGRENGYPSRPQERPDNRGNAVHRRLRGGGPMTGERQQVIRRFRRFSQTGSNGKFTVLAAAIRCRNLRKSAQSADQAVSLAVMEEERP